MMQQQVKSTISTSVSSDTSSLTCAICMSVFYQPITLSCGHTACRGCLRACIAPAKQAKQQCPAGCQTVVSIDKNAPINIIINNLVQTQFPREYEIRKEEETEEEEEEDNENQNNFQQQQQQHQQNEQFPLPPVQQIQQFVLDLAIADVPTRLKSFLKSSFPVFLQTAIHKLCTSILSNKIASFIILFCTIIIPSVLYILNFPVSFAFIPPVHHDKCLIALVLLLYGGPDRTFCTTICIILTHFIYNVQQALFYSVLTAAAFSPWSILFDFTDTPFSLLLLTKIIPLETFFATNSNLLMSLYGVFMCAADYITLLYPIQTFAVFVLLNYPTYPLFVILVWSCSLIKKHVVFNFKFCWDYISSFSKDYFLNNFLCDGFLFLFLLCLSRDFFIIFLLFHVASYTFISVGRSLLERNRVLKQEYEILVGRVFIVFNGVVPNMFRTN